MKFLVYLPWYLLIFLTNVSLSFQKLPMGNCDHDAFFYEFINPTIGWVGIGAVNLGDRDRLDNITISVQMEAKIDDQSYLGEVRKLYFTKIKTSDPIPKYSIYFEIRVPVDNPLPNIVRINVDGYDLCENPVQSNDTSIINLGYIYNSYLNTEQKFSEVIDASKSTTTDKYETISETEINNLNIEESIDCGRIGPLDNIDPATIDEKVLPRGGWPWLASIYAYNGEKLGFQCGATLISDKLVLTAAHCFFDNNQQINKFSNVVILGQYNLKKPQDQGTEIRYPKSVNIHPNYQKGNDIDSDIAIVELTESVPFTNYIRPACLWKKPSSKKSIVGHNGVIAGWGRDEQGNFFTELPRKAEIPVVSDETCLKSHDAFSGIISEAAFCAGWRNGTNGPCNGDSGAGLMFYKDDKWTIRGIISTSILSNKRSSSCDQSEYIVFTDVVPFLDWIKSFFGNPKTS